MFIAFLPNAGRKIMRLIFLNINTHCYDVIIKCNVFKTYVKMVVYTVAIDKTLLFAHFDMIYYEFLSNFTTIFYYNKHGFLHIYM